MGSEYRFTCDDCGFEAEVSGGFDVGMVAATQTIACRECGDLTDVDVGDAPSTSPEDVPKMALHCPKSPRHEVTQWNHPGPCPRCGKTMTRGPLTLLWD